MKKWEELGRIGKKPYETGKTGKNWEKMKKKNLKKNEGNGRKR